MLSINRTLQKRSPSAGTLANPLPQLSSLPLVCPKIMNAALIPVYHADGKWPVGRKFESATVFADRFEPNGSPTKELIKKPSKASQRSPIPMANNPSVNKPK